jgi:hypothetical protein
MRSDRLSLALIFGACIPLASFACSSSSNNGESPDSGKASDSGAGTDSTVEPDDGGSVDAPATNDGGVESGAGDSGGIDGGNNDGGSEAGVPVLLASGFDHPRSLASDGTSVLFFAYGWHDDAGLNPESRLVQVPVAGGPLTTRFTYGTGNAQGGTGEVPGGMTVDGTDLFFCASSHAWRMPIAAGNAVDLAPTGAPPTGVYGCGVQVVDAVNFYSGGDSNIPTMFSVPKDGGTTSEFAGPDTNAAAIGGYPMASDGTYVYWVPISGVYSNTMQRAIGAGGAPETFVAAPNPDAGAEQYLGFITSNLVFTGGYIYWLESGTGVLPYVLWKASTSGGAPAVPTVVAQSPYIYTGIVTDGTFIYWFEELNGLYSIKKTSVAGGGPITTVVADAISIAGYGNPNVFTVDANNVYWFASPNLYKAPK